MSRRQIAGMNRKKKRQNTQWTKKNDKTKTRTEKREIQR